MTKVQQKPKRAFTYHYHVKSHTVMDYDIVDPYGDVIAYVADESTAMLMVGCLNNRSFVCNALNGGLHAA
jgi:hypothetical protein